MLSLYIGKMGATRLRATTRKRIPSCTSGAAGVEWGRRRGTAGSHLLGSRNSEEEITNEAPEESFGLPGSREEVQDKWCLVWNF